MADRVQGLGKGGEAAFAGSRRRRRSLVRRSPTASACAVTASAGRGFAAMSRSLNSFSCTSGVSLRLRHFAHGLHHHRQDRAGTGRSFRIRPGRNCGLGAGSASSNGLRTFAARARCSEGCEWRPLRSAGVRRLNVPLKLEVCSTLSGAGAPAPSFCVHAGGAPSRMTAAARARAIWRRARAQRCARPKSSPIQNFADPHFANSWAPPNSLAEEGLTLCAMSAAGPFHGIVAASQAACGRACPQPLPWSCNCNMRALNEHGAEPDWLGPVRQVPYGPVRSHGRTVFYGLRQALSLLSS